MILVGIGLMFFGVIGFLFPYITITTAQDWSRLEDQTDQNVASPGTILPGQVVTTTPAPERHGAQNRLAIDAIGVDMPIFEGRDSNVLLKGGWLFPGTARPGQTGNAVVFGHRFQYLPPVSNTFFRLDKLSVGDSYVMTYGGERFIYRVIGTSIIEPTDFSVLKQGNEKWLTLITCAPAFSTKYRLVVIGELVE